MTTSKNSTIEKNIRQSLTRLARFGTNISDSHSCFIFLPPQYLGYEDDQHEYLMLGGYHSLCPDILANCTIRIGSGLIGWVARHGQAIHVSPFEHDSRTLGMYRDNRELKSLIGVPVVIDQDPHSKTNPCGVIVCDSKKSFAFSKLQGKLMCNLAEQVAENISLILNHGKTSASSDWSEFLAKGAQAVHEIGRNSIEVMRIRIANYSRLEHFEGVTQCEELSRQLVRLLRQSLPDHFPFYQLLNGDILVVLDNMMAAFYQNRFMALAEHIQSRPEKIELLFKREALVVRKKPARHLDEAIAATNFNGPEVSESGDYNYEYRRA